MKKTLIALSAVILLTKGAQTDRFLQGDPQPPTGETDPAAADPVVDSEAGGDPAGNTTPTVPGAGDTPSSNDSA